MSKIFNTGETSITLKETYNPEGSVLRECQLRMLEMLIYIDNVCNLLGIPYILDGGTVLGAVRHGGFIPWDDDVDISIPRKYFRKLNKYLEENPHPQFVIQNSRTDSGYMGAWSVLRDTKSEYIQDTKIHNIRKYRGVQVDIFPLEETFGPKVHWFANRLADHFIEKQIGKGNLVMARIGYILCYKFVFPTIRFASIFNRNNKLMYTLGTCWFQTFDKDLFHNRSTIEFEDFSFFGPHDINKYLHELYGDYMALPTIDKRDHHQATYKIWD